MKLRSNIKYKDGKFTYFLKKVCTGSGEHGDAKRLIITNWRLICIKYYSKCGQYGICARNQTEGVLTPAGGWSRINQFNTHPTCNEYIAQYLNQQLSNDFIAKGIDDFEGKKIELIQFDSDKTSKEQALYELNKYFFWLNHYGHQIFVDQSKVSDDDFLSILIDKTISTMSVGTYGELCFEYYFKSVLIKYDIYRSSTIKGNKDDFRGVDFYSIEKEHPEKKRTYQVKSVKVFPNNIIRNPINAAYYYKNNIDYLTIVELNVGYENELTVSPTRMLFFRMEPNLFTTHKNFNKKDTYSFKPESILMEQPISQIFKSKIFYEFFMYCTKHGLEFLMDVSDTTSAIYDHDIKSVSVNLPSDDKKYQDQPIIDTWTEIINQIETGTNRENSLLELKKFHK